jgi:Na+/melibiose symporter-like transporter
VAARWFPVKERASATGLATLAQYIGILIAMVVTPMLVVSSPSEPDYGSGTGRMVMIYGIVTIVSAVTMLLLMREKPATPPSEAPYERFDFYPGLKHIFRLRDMWIMILLFTIGLGIFNAVNSMVDSIAEYLGVDDSNGMLGGMMLIGGIIGAVIIPILSDLYKKRKLFLIICVVGMVPGIAGIVFAPQLTGGFGVNPDAAHSVALISSFILGFSVMSAGPIGFQYAAEVSAPAHESSSQGLLLLAGQVSGIIMVTGMSMRSKTFLPAFMVAFVVLILISAILIFFIRESPVIRAEKDTRTE